VREFTIGEGRIRLARRHFLRIESYAEPIAGITAALVGPHATDPAAPPGNFMHP